MGRERQTCVADAGTLTFVIVARVLIVYSCILLVHSLLYWGRYSLRRRAGLAC